MWQSDLITFVSSPALHGRLHMILFSLSDEARLGAPYPMPSVFAEWS
jgi:hypothetical protein